MKLSRLLLTLFFLFIFPAALFAADIPYEVHFVGVDDEELVSTLKKVSELITLQNSPPATKTALRRRAEADIGNLVKGIHSFGYYNAKVDLEIDTDISPVQITFRIDLGGSYPLANFIIIPYESEENESCDEEPFPFESVSLRKLGVTLGEPALPKTILKAESNLLILMAKKGYTLANVKKREVIADQTAKNVTVKLTVDSGSLIYFGPTTIEGLTTVKECAIRKKIAWQEDEKYEPALIENTLNDIEATGLFSSVSIDSAPETSCDQLMPITIQVTEAKHRTIGGGLSYNTQIGPGVVATWQNRNVGGIGERITFHADVAQKLQMGKLLYQEFDYLVPKQNLLWMAEVESQQTKGYNDLTFSLSGQIERTLSKKFKISYGADLSWIKATKSNNNRGFVVLQFPLQGRWSTANSLLNPTRGKTVLLKVAPSEALNHSTFYCVNTITGIWYLPLTSDDRWVFAAKGVLGSIWGCSDHGVPPPERFYLGSETALRGYSYMTVSPLDEDGDHKRKPIGGRSMILGAFEARYRINEEFGVVGFYEIGNAYKSPLPQFSKKQRTSVGGGLRYHTSVGPLRFDIAFPLNPRKGIDRGFQFYLSIGQSF